MSNFFRCQRNGNCSVSASDATFGDPCSGGASKYLEVSYTCERPAPYLNV